MIRNDVAAVIAELYQARPGADRVEFEVIALGSPEKPWSVWERYGRGQEGHGFTACMPNREIYENQTRMAKLKGRGYPLLDSSCRDRFGLGSAYLFVSADDQILYIGMAPNEPIWSCVQKRHLRGYAIVSSPSGVQELRFPKNRWGDAPAAQYIARGQFYMVFVVNVKPWGVFENPFAPGFVGHNPFTEIGRDLEGWLAMSFGMPPLNSQAVRAREDIRTDLPWGHHPHGADAALCDSGARGG